jgi:hypothetical protein
MDGTTFVGNVGVRVRVNGTLNSCSTEGEGKDKTNGKVVPVHVIRAYVMNTGTVPHS